MKKGIMFLLTVFALVLCSVMANAADIVFYNTNQATLVWNAVTADVDGDPCVCTYEILIVNKATDPDKTNPVVVPVETTRYLMTVGIKGRYYVGIRAVIDDEEGDLKSPINWGDDPDGQSVAPFGIKYLALPNIPDGFHN